MPCERKQLISKDKIKLVPILLLILFLITSCATIMNKPFQNLTVFTTKPSAIIFKHDTLRTNNNKVNLPAERKKEYFQFSAITDSLSKKIEVKPRTSLIFYSNLYFNYGLGMLVDRNSPKRYEYPHRIYLNSSDTIGRYYHYSQSNKKGNLYIHLSLPHINSFLLKPDNETTKINTGFWGITGGLDYYHKKNQFWGLYFSGVSAFFLPFPAAVDISGEYQRAGSTFISISNNHKIKRFSVGYGFSFAQNTWNFKYSNWLNPPPPSHEPVRKSNHSFGMVFPVYFQTGEYFNLGIVYRPSFFRPDAINKFEYEHLISIDFAWKIRIKR